MKTFLMGLLAIATVQTNAMASNSGSAVLTAQSGSQTVLLSDDQYEPIYAQEAYQDTCSRTVFDHTETTCQTVSEQVCHGGGNVCQTVSDQVCNSSGCTTIPRSVCHTEPETCTSVPRSVCSSHNIDRTEYYSCTQYRTVVTGQQLVKTYNHQVEVAVASPALLAGAQLNVAVGASLGSISAQLSNSVRGGLLAYSITTLSQNDTGQVVNSVEKITIDLALTAAQVNQISNVALPSVDLGHNAIRFLLQNGSSLVDHLKISINLVRDRAIGSNTTLYDGTVNSSTLGLVGQGSDLNALIPYSKLGSFDPLGNNKYDLAVSIGLDAGAGTPLNANDFSAQLQKSVSVSYHRINASF
jgi:hypothetical protein